MILKGDRDLCRVCCWEYHSKGEEGRCFIQLKWFGGSPGSGRGGCCGSRGLSGLQYPALNTRGHKLSKSRLFSPGSVKASIEICPNTSRLRKANTKLYCKSKGKVNVVAASEHRWKLYTWDAYSCAMRTCVKGTCMIHMCTGLFLNARRCGNSVLLLHLRENCFINEWKHIWVKQVILMTDIKLLYKMHLFFCRLYLVER